MANQCNLSVKEQGLIVLRLIQSPERAGELAQEASISESTLYEWRDAFLQGGFARMGGQGKHGVERLQATVVLEELDQINGEKRAQELLEEGYVALEVAVKENSAEREWQSVHNLLTVQVGLAISPARSDALPNREFMNVVSISNPGFVGWPPWPDTRNYEDERHRAYVHEGRLWQALFADLRSRSFKSFDFYRFDPVGEFYLYRVLQDDLLEERVQPRTSLDGKLMMRRVAEVLSVGITLGRKLGWQSDAIANFSFKWTGLEDRDLVPWSDPFNSIGTFYGRSQTSIVEASAHLPIGTPYLSLTPHVTNVVSPLLVNFDGYEAPEQMVEECLQDVINNR